MAITYARDATTKENVQVYSATDVTALINAMRTHVATRYTTFGQIISSEIAENTSVGVINSYLDLGFEHQSGDIYRVELTNLSASGGTVKDYNVIFRGADAQWNSTEDKLQINTSFGFAGADSGSGGHVYASYKVTQFRNIDSGTI